VWSAAALAIYWLVLAALRFFGRVGGAVGERWVLRVADVVQRTISAGIFGYHTPYLASLSRSVRDIDLLGVATQGEYTLPLQQVYVEVSVLPRAFHETSGEPFVGKMGEPAERRTLASFLGGGKPGVFAVIGGPGSGKTTLLRRTALELCQRRFRARVLPVLLYLRNHVDTIVRAADVEPTLASVVTSVIWMPREIPADWLERRLDRGRCLVMLDGLDEVAIEDDRQKVVTWVQRQIERYPNNDYVITSRPYGYLANPLSKANILQVRRFTEEQISQFIQDWYYAIECRSIGESGAKIRIQSKTKADDLLSRLRSQSALYDLAANPLLLTMMANVHRYRGALPGSRAALYGEMCQMLLHHRQEAKGLSAVGTGLRGEQKERVARELALYMMQAQIRNILSDEAESVIRASLRRVTHTSSATASTFLDEISRSGLLVEREFGVYAFVSYGFQEYLAAAQIREQPSEYLHALIEGVDNPWWKETILLWSAAADATPIIEACLNSGTAYAHSLAVECVNIAREVSPEVSHALSQRLRLVDAGTSSNIARPESPDNASASLINYVTRTHGGAGADVVNLLLRLAEIVVSRRREAATDLYLAALSASDGNSATVPGMDEVLIRYLQSLTGNLSGDPSPELTTVLKAEALAHGHAFFKLLLALLAETNSLREMILDILCKDSVLIDLGIDYLADTDTQGLRASWVRAIDQWRRDRWWLIHGLGDIERLEISDQALASYIEIIQDYKADYKARAPSYLLGQLGGVVRALSKLRDFMCSRTLEARENALRSVKRVIDALQEDIRAAPTALAVEVIEPVAEQLKELTDQEHRKLIETCPARPRLNLALDEGRSAHGVVTVQVKVANAVDSAPVESAELLVNVNSNLFTPILSRIQLTEAVRGGTSRVVLVRLKPVNTRRHISLFELALMLRYQPRFSKEIGLLDVTLKVPVPRPEKFKPVPNPFLDGATGRPVQSQEMFFGRDELIDRIRARLRETTSPGAGVAIFGQKRAGKSSIRLHLVKRLRKLDEMPVVDIGNIGDLSPEANEVTGTRLLALPMWRIIEGANEVLPKKPSLIHPDRDRVSFLTSDDPVYDCAKLLERHREENPGQLPLVVFIDEFQYLETWIKKRLVSPVFMQAFKALIEKQLFHLVIVGQSDLDRLIRDDPNAFGVFSTERVTYLAERHARRLIEVPIQLASQSRYRERAVDHILELTGGNAFTSSGSAVNSSST
jgi:hypothetical protein